MIARQEETVPAVTLRIATPARRLRWFEYVLALTPFALAFTGVIGLAIGPAACALNLVVMRSSVALWVRATAALVVAVLAIFVWAIVVTLMR